MNISHKNKLFLFALSAFLAVILAYYQPLADFVKFQRGQAGLQGARIEAEPAAYDFGTIRYQDKSKQEFEIKNTGSENLEILRISTSCGCTKAEMLDGIKTISSGTSAKMVITMDPSSHKSYYDIGEIKRVVYVKTNDANRPEMQIELSANVTKPENSVTFEIKGEKGQFVPDKIEAKENNFVELKFSSTDLKYNFRIDEFGINETFEVQDQKSVVFYADKKGEYRIYDDGNVSSAGKLIVE